MSAEGVMRDRAREARRKRELDFMLDIREHASTALDRIDQRISFLIALIEGHEVEEEDTW